MVYVLSLRYNFAEICVMAFMHIRQEISPIVLTVISSLVPILLNTEVSCNLPLLVSTVVPLDVDQIRKYFELDF